MQQQNNDYSLQQYSELQRRLLNDFQHGLPLSPTPYRDMARQLGVTEDEVIQALVDLQEAGTISRVGAVFRPNRVGVSTLAAMSVPVQRMQEVADIVNACSQVNHNYEREHAFNMWFVVTAASRLELQATLRLIEARTGLAIMSLPMVEDYHIDLGFPLQWGVGGEVET
jgi:DNA-binding Lrp family transcriptional regulator